MRKMLSVILFGVLITLFTACGGGGGGDSSGGGSNADVTAPTTPTNLNAITASSSQINLSWDASTDSVGVAGYKIYRNGTYLKSITGITASDTGLSANTQYCYKVSAFDAANNESSQSTQACTTTDTIAGSLDTSFGTDGIVITDLGTAYAYARSVAIQADGKIVVAGDKLAYSFALARYNANGSLDTSFGAGGIVTTDIGLDNSSEYANSVAIQSDGKIVAAGISNPGSSFDFTLVRYNTNGSLDTGFGTGGSVTTAIGTTYDSAYSVAIQSDGKIVVAGDSTVDPNSGFKDFALVRYNANGSLDTSFGAGGIVTTELGSNDSAYSVAIQSDGKIVAAGTSVNNFVLVRYNTNGSLDTSFGAGGIVTTTLEPTSDDVARSVAIQSDGKIIAAGTSQVGTRDKFALVRYNTNGSLDTSFGAGGKVTTPIGIYHDYAHSVAIQTDGKIVVSGTSYTKTVAFNMFYDFALVRYNANGSLDTTFGTGGIVTTGSGGAFHEVSGVAIQADGKIVAVASLNGPDYYDFAILRYLP